MPLTPHPSTFTSTILPSTSMDQGSIIQLSGHGQSNNDTFIVSSTPDRCFGSNGETTGVAKPLTKVMGQKMGGDTAQLFENYARPRTKEGRNMPLGYRDDVTLGGDRGMITRQVMSYQADKLLGLNSLSEEKLAGDAKNGYFGVSVQVDGAAVISSKGVLNFDPTNPVTQRGLSDLEVSDYITGQVDRHMGNVFVDPSTGKVTGIDNDMSFAEVSREVSQKRAESVKMVTGMPRVMHEETKQKILAADPEELRKLLSQPMPKGGPQALSPAAIKGAVDRLIELQTELKSPTCKIQVVQQFDKNTYDAAMQLQIDTYNAAMVNEKSVGTQIYGNLQPYKNYVPEEMGFTYALCERTSYLGSMDMAKQMHNLNPDALTNNVANAKATVMPGLNSKMVAAYSKMTPTEKSEFDQTLKELNKLEARQDQLQKRVDKLAHPGLLEKVESIGKGGVTASYQHEDAKLQQAKLDVDAAKAKLLMKVDSALKLAPERPKQSAPHHSLREDHPELAHDSPKAGLQQKKKLNIDGNSKAPSIKGKEEHVPLRKDHPELVQGQGGPGKKTKVSQGVS